MKRVLVDRLGEVGTEFEPDPDEAHHLLRVRRIRPGETVEILDGKGGLALGEVITVENRVLRIRLTETLDAVRESPLRLTLAVAVPAQLSTFDGALPSLVQLGVDRIYLVPTAYSGRIKKDAGRYLSRLDSIAANALKQCGRTRAPRISVASDLDSLLARCAVENRLNIVLHPGTSSIPSESQPDAVGLLVGPEGGLTESEVARAREAGFLRRGLGPRILEMPTAMIGACFWAQERFGDLGFLQADLVPDQ